MNKEIWFLKRKISDNWNKYIPVLLAFIERVYLLLVKLLSIIAGIPNLFDKLYGYIPIYIHLI